jgi:hypothetical protein
MPNGFDIRHTFHYDTNMQWSRIWTPEQAVARRLSTDGDVGGL